MMDEIKDLLDAYDRGDDPYQERLSDAIEALRVAYEHERNAEPTPARFAGALSRPGNPEQSLFMATEGETTQVSNPIMRPDGSVDERILNVIVRFAP